MPFFHSDWWRWPLDPGQIGVPLGHEGDREPVLVRDLLHGALEQGRFVRRAQRVVVANRRLVDTWPGLGVQPFDLDVEAREAFHQVAHQVGVLSGADPAVAEHARVEGRQSLEALVVERLARLFEQVELEFGAEFGGEPLAFAARDDALQERARAGRMRGAALVTKVGQHRHDPGLPGQEPESAGVEHGVDVWVAAVPTGDLGVVVEHVGHVPAEDDVAKPKALAQRRLQLLEGDVLAAQHSVDVEASDFGPRDPLPSEVGNQLLVSVPRLLRQRSPNTLCCLGHDCASAIPERVTGRNQGAARSASLTVVSSRSTGYGFAR